MLVGCPSSCHAVLVFLLVFFLLGPGASAWQLSRTLPSGCSVALPHPRHHNVPEGKTRKDDRRPFRSPPFKSSLHANPTNVAPSSSPLDFDRRSFLSPQRIARGALLTMGMVFLHARTAQAAASTSRTDGYAIQHTDDEWRQLLSPMQYYVLREGGTERPYYSVLERESRPGVYNCAGCGSTLFDASQKFHSGTGWPSFATGIDDDRHVQVQDVGALVAALAGTEVRCANCGGHLGDVFNDGWLFPGTPAAITGKRYCIDGAALVFVPEGFSKGGPTTGTSVRGDQSPSTVSSYIR